jgi:hypothetical protein
VSADAFKLINGFRFWYRGDTYRIESGLYAPGRGAMRVMAPDGQVEAKLTVRMTSVEATIADDEFCVKWAGDEGALTRADMHTLLGLGLFGDTGLRLSSGYVEAYAAVWRFARCFESEHDFVTDHGPNWVVGCIDCMAALKLKHDEHRVRADARDCIKRMENLERMSK